MVTQASTQAVVRNSNPISKSIPIAEKGITTSRDCAQVLAAITRDVLVGAVTPQVGNTSCNAIGKLMKLKELEIKYGEGHGQGRMLQLT